MTPLERSPVAPRPGDSVSLTPRADVPGYLWHQASRIAALERALREQYELAHGLSDPAVDHGKRDEFGCDDRCRRALALLGEGA